MIFLIRQQLLRNIAHQRILCKQQMLSVHAITSISLGIHIGIQHPCNCLGTVDRSCNAFLGKSEQPWPILAIEGQNKHWNHVEEFKESASAWCLLSEAQGPEQCLAARQGARGARGLGSVSSEQMESRTLLTVSAGLHWSFRMSRQIWPL